MLSGLPIFAQLPPRETQNKESKSLALSCKRGFEIQRAERIALQEQGFEREIFFCRFKSLALNLESPELIL